MSDDRIREEKNDLRRRLRERLGELDAGSRRRTSAAAVARLWTLPEIASASPVVLYRSLPTEVATDELIADLLGRGRRVFCPRLEADSAMGFLEVGSRTRWRRGAFGVEEPEDGAALAGPGRDKVIVLVPGLAFSPRGERLGRGGGHYDRALASPTLAGAFRIGLAFDFQVLETIPVEAHDQRVEAVVTEQRVLRAAAGPG